MTVRDAVRLLTEAGVASPDHDARLLARHATRAGVDFDDLIRRRAQRVPLQHLTGSVGFRYVELDVGPGVFVPRPESEVVAGLAIELAHAAGPAPVVVDLCSGSGAIALSVADEVRHARVHALELDPAALRWLTRNARSRRSDEVSAVTVHAGDVRSALVELDGLVDIVVSNPPYLSESEVAGADPEVREHDPMLALVAGPDGLDVIRTVATTAQRLLKPGGWVVVEHSDTQGETVPDLLRRAGFSDVADHSDLAGSPRVTTGRRS